MFPAVILYDDGVDQWLADGFHRYQAAQQLGRETILSELRTGQRIEALRHALGANATNGLRRTNADKRRCVDIAMREFSHLSTNFIADICAVSHTFVEGRRTKLATVASSSEESMNYASTQTDTRIGKDGKARRSPQIAKAKPSVSSNPGKHEIFATSARTTTDVPDLVTSVAAPSAALEPEAPTGELYVLKDGESVCLPCDGFLSAGHLKAALGKMTIVAKQVGDGRLTMAKLSLLERSFLKITAAVFATFGEDPDPDEREAIVAVLKSVADTVELAE